MNLTRSSIPYYNSSPQFFYSALLSLSLYGCAHGTCCILLDGVGTCLWMSLLKKETCEMNQRSNSLAFECRPLLNTLKYFLFWSSILMYFSSSGCCEIYYTIKQSLRGGYWSTGTNYTHCVVTLLLELAPSTL